MALKLDYFSVRPRKVNWFRVLGAAGAYAFGYIAGALAVGWIVSFYLGGCIVAFDTPNGPEDAFACWLFLVGATSVFGTPVVLAELCLLAWFGREMWSWWFAACVGACVIFCPVASSVRFVKGTQNWERVTVTDTWARLTPILLVAAPLLLLTRRRRLQ